MKRNYILFLVIPLLMGVSLSSLKAMAMSVETKFHYTEGDYGTDQTATFMSFPLEIKGQPFKGVSLGMSIPYVYQKCSSEYTSIPVGSKKLTGPNINPIPYNNRGKGKPWNIITGGSSAPPGQGRPGQLHKPIKDLAPDSNNVADADHGGDTNGGDNPEEIRRDSGMGDIFLSFSLSPSSLFPSLARDRLPPYVPSLDLSGGLKLPTADPNSLGTGELDFILGIKLTWKISFFEPYLYGDHTWIGDTAEEDFENVFSFGCGTSFPVFRRNTVFIELFGCEALYPGDDSSLSFQVGMERTILSRSWIYGYGLAGLNEESPDFGFGVSAGIFFD